MTYPLASEQDLLEMLAGVQQQLDAHDSKTVVNQERWWNMRETLIESKQRIVADLERVRAAP